MIRVYLGLSCRACLMDAEEWLLVQFHANSWALAFGAPMFGAKLVLPGGSGTAKPLSACLTRCHTVIIVGLLQSPFEAPKSPV